MKHKRVLLLAVVILGVTAAAFAAAPTIAISVTGNPTPGGTATATAKVTITDGSTLQGLKWTQVGGVPLTITGTTADSITYTLPARKVYRDELVKILEEPPIPMSGTFEGGLQNRFGVVAAAPLAIEEATAAEFDIEVTTTSGVYKLPSAVPANVYPTFTGIRNVPILLPVIAQAKEQASYNWTLTIPTGSSAVIQDANTRFPEFVPDVAGTYVLSITDLATGKPQTFSIHAGTWKGIITGQDADGKPTVDTQCTSCHVKNTPHFDLFTPWKSSGHAEIFSQNVNTPNNHYSTACLGCHSVGFNSPAVKNNGIDDQPDFQALLESGLIEHAAPGNYTKIVNQFPKSTRFANIQCENCHGPQDSLAHKNGDESRMSLSSDVCGSCHGEPARHGRFQQWQVSSHANYETAKSEGTNAGCAGCHSAQGFVQWGEKAFASNAVLNVTWTTDEVHPQTCATCHDPHDVGTTSGGPTTNAKVRISGSTPKTMGGYTVTNVGTAALCITCHNGRRDLRDDAHFTVADATRAPHEGPQGDIVMGYNMYFTTVGVKGFHGQIQDACVTCHMEKTPPPADLSYQLGGTNHTFTADKGICTKCHNSITAEEVQTKVEGKVAALKTQIEIAIQNSMQTQIRLGNQISLNGTIVKNASDIKSVEFISSHGRQGVNVNLANGTKVSDLSLQTVKVIRPGGSSVEIYAVTDPAVAKSGWNYFMVEADKSKGVHNPAFVNSALDVSTFALKNINANPAAVPGGGSSASLGGGLGNGAGAVTCTTPYVYWTDIAGHTPGQNGSQWRTDVVARNLSGDIASLRFVLHLSSGPNLETTGTVPGSGQNSFEDIVALMGNTSAIGSLEICSDKPILLTARNFNKADVGTFGQNLDGRVADLGYNAGQTVNLIGLRQKTDNFRSNISVTNGGTTEAQVSISLFDAKGTSLTTYTLTVPAGKVINDGEVFKNRANAPDVDWGFATLTVLKGTNILTAGSLIDAKTSDPTTIPPKQ